jgi:uncharacterized membrane protein (UPF0127 family)
MNQVKINNNLFDVKTVVSEKDIQAGMMGKKFGDKFNGMLFVMEPGQHSFWMKNCQISLDIIFIKNMKVNNIHKNCPPCRDEQCESYSGEGDLILEIAGGDCDKYDIKEGDDVYIQA